MPDYSKLLFLFLALVFSSCQQHQPLGARSTDLVEKPAIEAIASEPIRQVLANSQEQLSLTKNYTQDYFSIPYPNGDPPIETGACTDVIVRGFRAAGVDLQKEVHEDIRANFKAYPNKWGLQRPDTNIDHRRVPNLQTFFARKGKSIPISSRGEDYKPGDVVSWDLNGKGMTHIGLVSHLWSDRTKRYLIIHNIGTGAKAEDRLFEWKITGHYRYF
ncbi:DUF1287 domain-containing protein [soil metagenome]